MQNMIKCPLARQKAHKLCIGIRATGIEMADRGEVSEASAGG